MGNSKWREPTAEAICVAMDLVQRLERGKVTWSVILSRPGRDGEFLKEWSNVSGRLDADQMEDMVNWVALSVSNALIAWDGVQEVLQA